MELSATEARWLELAEDPRRAAERVELVYVDTNANVEGLTRRRCGKGWAFLDTRGEFVSCNDIKMRCRKLAIPPAWVDVWICADPRGHIQATGRDEAGRKQYIYHPLWCQVRAQTKFNRMPVFGRALPLVRARVQRSLSRSPRGGELSHERVVAAVVALLDRTLIRVGNDEYAAKNESHGLTTLLEEHVEVRDECITLDFRGKSGVHHIYELDDKRLARVLAQCHELPGQRLFQYRDEEGEIRPVTSCDVNDWLRSVSGVPLTAKDFRTFGGCVMAGDLLAARPAPTSQRQARMTINEVVKSVCARLGNTPSVCRKYYVDPRLLECFERGELAGLWTPPERIYCGADDDEDTDELGETETAVLKQLERWLEPDELCLMGFLNHLGVTRQMECAS